MGCSVQNQHLFILLHHKIRCTTHAEVKRMRHHQYGNTFSLYILLQVLPLSTMGTDPPFPLQTSVNHFIGRPDMLGTLLHVPLHPRNILGCLPSYVLVLLSTRLYIH